MSPITGQHGNVAGSTGIVLDEDKPMDSFAESTMCHTTPRPCSEERSLFFQPDSMQQVRLVLSDKHCPYNVVVGIAVALLSPTHSQVRLYAPEAGKVVTVNNSCLAPYFTENDPECSVYAYMHHNRTAKLRLWHDHTVSWQGPWDEVDGRKHGRWSRLDYIGNPANELLVYFHFKGMMKR